MPKNLIALVLILLGALLVSRQLMVGIILTPLFWFPAGILASALLLYDIHWRYLLACYYIALLIAFADVIWFHPTHSALVGALIILLLSSVEILSANLFVKISQHQDKQIEKLSNAPAALKLLFAAFIAAFILLLNIPLLEFYFAWPPRDYLSYALRWFPSQILSFILLVPLCCQLHGVLQAFSRKVLLSAVLVITYTCIVLYFMVHKAYIGTPIQAIPFVLLPGLFYSAFKLGTSFTCLLLVVVFSVILYSSALGLGPFSQHGVEAIILTQIFCLVIATCVLVLGGVLNAEKATLKLVEQANQNLDAKVLQRTESLRAEINQRRAAKKRLSLIANTDLVTNLPNRNTLYQDIKRLIEKSSPFTIIFCDLDRFKIINDSFGHGFGDSFLKEIGNRIRVENYDVYRWGGDEFIILQPGSIETGLNRAEQVRNIIRQPVLIQEQELYSEVSIGISIFPDQAKEPDSLLKFSDIALNHAKSSGGNKIEMFKDASDQQIMKFHATEIALRKAIENQEFVVFYQPKYSMTETKLIGFEALVRWRRASGRIVGPNEFIPAAES